MKGLLAAVDCARDQTDDDANACGSDDLEADPLASRRIRFEQGHEPEAHKHEHPANVVRGTIFVRGLDDNTEDDREGGYDEGCREDVHAGTDRRRRHACLEVHREVIYRGVLTHESL